MCKQRSDIVLALREARRVRGLTQKDVARLSGVSDKTISSFETGARVSALKVSQLEKLLKVYGLTLAEFFSWSPEGELARLEGQATTDPRRSNRVRRVVM